MHDVYVADDQSTHGIAILKGLCFSGQQKSEESHKLSQKFESGDNGVANVVQTSSSYFYGVVASVDLILN